MKPKNKVLGSITLLQACFYISVHGRLAIQTWHGQTHPHPPLPESEEVFVAPESPVATSKQVIESFHVQTDVRYRFATTKMSSLVRNTAGSAHEMTFGMTLPKEAFIVSFAMTIDGKVYDGEVKKKKAAKEQYNQAVQRGQSAGHIRQTPRHSNRFDMSVNVANGTAVNFTLVYQQILSRRLGVYEYEMHVEPGQAVRDFNLEVFIQENRPLLFVKTPQLRKASVVDNSIQAPNDLTTVDRPSETTAYIQYKPTLVQQGEGGLSARFVAQYDVEHSDNGDVLVADGYFLHLFSPKPRNPLPKDIVFVLDVSGSMSGSKISQLKDAMKAILEDLTEDDRFNILTFNGEVSQWKRVLTEVTSGVVQEAKEFVRSMNANGGTNINDALVKALEELRGREVQTRVGMIFFLTDGEATVGETNTANIARNVKSKNVDQTSIYSLAFGQGANYESLKTISTQNYGYARKIYEASDAALQVESLYDEISRVAMKNVSVKYLPSVTKTTETLFPIVQNGTEIMVGGCIDLRIHLRQEEVDIFQTLPIPDSPGSTIFQAEIEGTQKEGAVEITLEIDDINEVTIDADDSLNSFFTMPRDYSGIVEKMWAFLTIKQMLREKQGAVEDTNKVKELDKKILEMSLQYKFVTPLTSMVVTKPDSDSPVESGLEDADKPVGRPTSAYAQWRSGHRSRSGNNGRRLYAGHGGPGVPKRVFHHPGGVAPKVGMSMSVPMSLPYDPSLEGHLLEDPGPSLAGGFADVFETYHPPTANRGVGVGGGGSSVSVSKPSRSRGKSGGGGGGRRGRRKKSGKGKKLIGILRSVVFRTDQTTVCLEFKKIPAGKYLLAQVEPVVNTTKGFKAQLVTGCLKNCRFVVPERVVLSSGGKTTSVNLTSLDSWKYQQHSDFDVTFVKMNEMVLDHQSATIAIVRNQKGKKMLFSIELQLKTNPSSSSSSSSSAMTDMMLKPKRGRKQRKTPKACLKANADLSMKLMKRKALKYKVV